jgi:hypothetical protein
MAIKERFCTKPGGRASLEVHSFAVSLRRRIYRPRVSRVDFRETIDIILPARRSCIFYVGSSKIGEDPETVLEYSLIPKL